MFYIGIGFYVLVVIYFVVYVICLGQSFYWFILFFLFLLFGSVVYFLVIYFLEVCYLCGVWQVVCFVKQFMDLGQDLCNVCVELVCMFIVQNWVCLGMMLLDVGQVEEVRSLFEQVVSLLLGDDFYILIGLVCVCFEFGYVVFVVEMLDGFFVCYLDVCCKLEQILLYVQVLVIV